MLQSGDIGELTEAVTIHFYRVSTNTAVKLVEQGEFYFEKEYDISTSG